jgi:hypothetical protein
VKRTTNMAAHTLAKLATNAFIDRTWVDDTSTNAFIEREIQILSS